MGSQKNQQKRINQIRWAMDYISPNIIIKHDMILFEAFRDLLEQFPIMNFRYTNGCLSQPQ